MSRGTRMIMTIARDRVVAMIVRVIIVPLVVVMGWIGTMIVRPRMIVLRPR